MNQPPNQGPGAFQPPPAQSAAAPPAAPPGRASHRPPPKASIVRYKAALRKAIRRKAKEPEIDFLNITAMLDLMTIILVFLIKSLASSTASIPQSTDLSLPTSVMTAEPSQEGVVVVVSKTQILVGDDPKPVVLLPPREQLAQSGVDAKYKRSGPNDLYIVDLARALSHAREQHEAIRGKSETSEAIIVADATTPYRLFIEVLFTLGQSQFGRYHLMVISGKKN